MTNKIYFEKDLPIEYLKKCIDEYSNLGEPTYLFNVYYPFAKVDIDIYERAYENFDAMERYILAYINLGIFKNIDDISKMTSIPKEQVSDIIKNLIVSNQITEKMEITKLGKSSLKENRKNLNEVRRIKVMADGITGTVIKKDIFRDRDLGSTDALTFWKIPSFIPIGELTEEKFKYFYDNFSFGLDPSNTIIPINFNGIKYAEVTDVVYIPLYIVKFKNMKEAILLRKYSSKDENGEFFDGLKPLFLSKEQQKQLNNMEADVIIDKSTDDKLQKEIKEMCHMFTKSTDDSNQNIQLIAKEEIDNLNLTIDKEQCTDNSIIYKLISSDDSDNYLLNYKEYIGENEYLKYPIVMSSINGAIIYIKGKLPVEKVVTEDAL